MDLQITFLVCFCVLNITHLDADTDLINVTHHKTNSEQFTWRYASLHKAHPIPVGNLCHIPLFDIVQCVIDALQLSAVYIMLDSSNQYSFTFCSKLHNDLLLT